VNPAGIMQSSLMEGINYTFFISTFIAAVALFLTFFIKKPVRIVSEEEKNSVYDQVPVEK
ncbi:MAG: MFS transporter, partial [Paenisporosarcina sp.]